MVWDGMEWSEMLWDGMGQLQDGMVDGIRRHGLVCDGMGWLGNGIGWYGMIQDVKGWYDIV